MTWDWYELKEQHAEFKRTGKMPKIKTSETSTGFIVFLMLFGGVASLAQLVFYVLASAALIKYLF